jgi:hypothetical protein
VLKLLSISYWNAQPTAIIYLRGTRVFLATEPCMMVQLQRVSSCDCLVPSLIVISSRPALGRRSLHDDCIQRALLVIATRQPINSDYQCLANCGGGSVGRVTQVSRGSAIRLSLVSDL